MSHPRVSVVIVNWNGRDLLGACLATLEKQTYTDFETIVVDNGSTDGSVDLLQPFLAPFPEPVEGNRAVEGNNPGTGAPRIRLIANPENRGFAAANNQAINASQAEFIATLNNDAYPEPEWLLELVQAMDADSQIGSCASKMLFAGRPGVINSAGIAIDRVGIAWDRLGGRPDAGDDPPGEVFGACAGAALYRRSMLDRIGLFDEDFFAYLEDVDLAWRAQAAGWRAFYVPSARVMHYHSATGVEGSPFKSRLLGRNKLWLLAKNYPWPQLLWYSPLVAVYDLGSVFVALLHGDPNPAVGRLQALLGLVTMWQKRITPAENVMQWMEPVAPPWKVWQRYRHL